MCKLVAAIEQLQVCVNLDIKSLGAASIIKFSLILDISLVVMPIAFAYPAADPHFAFM